MVEYSMADLVCLHLQSVDDISSEPVAYEASTPGIAEAVELGEETIADRVALLSTLSTLPEQGLLEEGTETVEEYAEQRNVYALTPDGRQHARDVRDRLQDETLLVRTAEDEMRVPLDEIDEHLDAESDPLVTALARADGDVLVLADDYGESEETFVDRETEFGALAERFDHATTGDPQTVFVNGEPGVGKTTLVRHLEPTVRDSDGLFLYGQCQSDVSDPYQPFLTAFSDLPADPRDRLAALLSDEDTVEADDREKLDAQRRTKFYEVCSILAESATDQPLVVCIDDLQWVDESTMALFTTVARRVDSGQLLLVGVCRPETATGDWPVAAARERLDDEAYTWLDIDCLDREWTGELVRQTVGALNVPERFVDLLYERTDGNPLFVTESVVGMMESHDIDPDLGVYPDSPDELTIADEVERTIDARFDVLDDDAQALLELGSCIGDGMPRAVLEAASNLDEPSFLDYAGILVGSGIWRYEDGQETLYFQSGVVRETVQGQIEADRWERLNARVADAYRTVDADAHAGAIAHHELEADNPEQALVAFRRAAEQATDVYAHEAAIEAYEQAIDIARDLGQAEAVIEMLDELGGVYHVLAEYEDAMRCYRYILERSDDVEQRQRTSRKRAQVADATGEFDTMLEHIESGLDLAEDPDASPVETARLHALRGHAMSVRGDPDEGVACYERALELAETVEDEQTYQDLRASLSSGLASVYRIKGEIDRAIELFEEVVDLRRDGDDRQKLATTLTNYGAVLDRASEYEQAVDVYEEARAIFDDIDDRGGMMTLLNNLGITYQYLGETEQAIACFEEGFELAEATENQPSLEYLSINLGYAYSNRAAFDQALAYADTAHDIAVDREDKTGLVCTSEIRGTIYLNRGDLSMAHETIADGLEVAREAEARNRIAGSLSILGKIHAERGDFEAAIEAFEEGIEQSLEYGNDQKATVNRAGLVDALVEAGDTDRASEYVDSLESATGSTEDVAMALAAYYRACGEYDTAKMHIQRGFDSLGDESVPVTRCDLLLADARVHAASGDHERARERATEAREIARDCGLSPFLDDATAILSELGTP